MPAGYSTTPLIKKLGIKNNFIVRIINMPENYFELLAGIPFGVIICHTPVLPKDFIHFFTTDSNELRNELISLKKEIKQNGIIWVSWPKKASKIQTDINEDIIRSHALEIGLVDIKVCAVDEIWSGLKLVIPVKERK